MFCTLPGLVCTHKHSLADPAVVHSHFIYRVSGNRPKSQIYDRSGKGRPGEAVVRLALCDNGAQLSVLRLFVPAQVHFALEGAPAQVTRKRLEPRVLSGVGDQVARLAESFAAHRALVRLLT